MIFILKMEETKLRQGITVQLTNDLNIGKKKVHFEGVEIISLEI